MSSLLHKRRASAIPALLAAALVGSGVFLSGCATGAQSGGLLGGAVGALAGQAIGGDTEATVIGTAVGAAAGYVIGNESDKANQPRRYNPNYDY